MKPIHIDIHIHNHLPTPPNQDNPMQAFEDALDDIFDGIHRIEVKLGQIRKEVRDMTPELETAVREAQETGDAVDSVLGLLDTLSQQIRDNADNPTVLRQLASDLDAQQQRIAKAVVANTPADPNAGAAGGAGSAGGASSAGPGSGNTGGATGTTTSAGEAPVQ